MMTPLKVVKSLHGIGPAHQEVGHVCDGMRIPLTGTLLDMPWPFHGGRHIRDWWFYGPETPGGYLWVPPPMAASRWRSGGPTTTRKVVKSLHGIGPAHPEVSHVCDGREYLRLEPSWICQGHSTETVTYMTGGFTDLRPRVGTYGYPLSWWRADGGPADR